jgi:hypothetical protein
MLWDSLSGPSSRISKYKRDYGACLKLSDTVLFWGLSPSSDCLKKHNISEGSSVADRMGNNMMWNDHEEDVDVRNECEEDEGTDCEDGDSYTDQ